MSDNVFYSGIIGFIFLFLFSFQRQKKLFISFFLGSLVYWILASKVIFFHNYYTGIIMITFSLSAGVLIANFSKLFKKKYLSCCFLALFILLLSSSSYDANIKRLQKEKNMEYIKQAVNYLLKNTREKEMYIDAEDNRYLTILTGRPQIKDYVLDQSEIKNSIKEIGFSETMTKYNISYLLTTKEEPEYERYVNLFTDKKLKPITFNRTDIILSIIDGNYRYFPDLEERNELIKKYKIKNKFILERKIGPYSFFKFAD